MLRSYVLGPCLLEKPLETDDDRSDFAELLRATQDRVTLVIPREDVESLTKAASRCASGARGEELRERIMQSLSNSGPEMLVLDGTTGGTPLERAVSALQKSGCTSMIVREPADYAGRLKLDPASCKFHPLHSAAREVLKDEDGQALESMQGLEEIERLIDSFFCIDSRLIIIDPYLFKAAAAEFRDGQRFVGVGLRKLIEGCVRTARQRNRPAVIQLIGDREKLLADKKSELGVARSLEDVVVWLERWVLSAGTAQAGSRPTLQVRVSSVSHFNSRGIRTSRRTWNIEHNLSDLGKVCTSQGGRAKTRSCTVRIHKPVEAKAIESLIKDAARASSAHLVTSPECRNSKP